MSSQVQQQLRLTVAASFPKHFFLENLAVRHDNSMLITVATRKELYYLPPPRDEAEVEPVLLHTFDEVAAGIAELEPDVFAIFTSNAYTTHETYLHRLDLRTWQPGAPAKPELILSLPEAVRSANGCSALNPQAILVADTFAGAIWRVDVAADGAAKARLWLKHGSMAHIKDTLPPPPQPGINGLRWSRRTGYVYYTTTGQKLFVRVSIDRDTLEPAGLPERVAGGGMYDDFCIDEQRGVAYVTVHRENRIDRISLEPGASPRAIAAYPPNELLLGPSSAAWGRQPGEIGRVAFVTTDGGTTAPPPDGARTAKVLRMEIG